MLEKLGLAELTGLVDSLNVLEYLGCVECNTIPTMCEEILLWDHTDTMWWGVYGDWLHLAEPFYGDRCWTALLLAHLVSLSYVDPVGCGVVDLAEALLED